MGFGVLFPGQGSQFVGMGADLFDARPDLLGERADAILGWQLRSLCLDGPEEELTRTDRAQPALYALSYALWEELAARLPFRPAAAAGHSLGEYTALAAGGAMDYFTGLELVSARGRAMAAAAGGEPSGMAALLGVDGDQAEQVAADRRAAGGRLWVANLNAPGQIVVAGSEADIAWIVEHGRDVGVRRAIRLNVAGAFHSPFMKPAAEDLRSALAGVAFSPPAFPVWANAYARPYEADGSDIGAGLAEQLTAPVRFSETLQAMAADGVSAFVHVGPGDVTAGMAKRSAPGSTTAAIGTLDGIDEAAEALGRSVQ